MLSFLIFCPVFFAFILWITPKESWVRPLALGMAFIEFIVSLRLLFVFDKGTSSMQLVEKIAWLPQVGINYQVGIDGISFWLVLLTTFLVPITILGSWTAIEKKVKGFHISVFLLQASMLGTFLATDAILFYTFFEISLVPMYLMIGIWGGANKIYASLKFFIYTMAGSVFLLLGIISLIIMSQNQLGELSASLFDFYKLNIPFISNDLLSTQALLFFAFCFAFAVKVPLFPLHTWLPDAHVQAPTPGSVILAGVMLKMGTYGFVRFVFPLFPEASATYGWIFMALGAIGIIYGALVAMVQPDIKKLVAYSSVSHMGYVVLGLFALNEYGISGGLYQMLNHGVSTGALFLLVGMIYERTHSREIKSYGGLAVVAPIFTILFLIVTLSSIAVPLTNGFIGEFLILMGTFMKSPYFGTIAVFGVVLGAAYMLWMVKRVFFGAEGEIVTQYKDKGLDINLREFIVMVPLIILIFWMGIYPKHFLSYSESSVKHLSENIKNYTIESQVAKRKF